MNEKFEPIKFDTWQELAKYVIDGGEVYFSVDKIDFIKLEFYSHGFKFLNGSYFDLSSVFNKTFIKKQPTLEELIAIKPRLCWVWDNGNDKHVEAIRNVSEMHLYDNAQMLTDDEIKQFLSDGE